jgi:hypothetical protein
MPFTEFYCDAASGSNINAGDKTANGVVTSVNGDWGNAAANRFTAASGTPFSGVQVGDFASVYLDGATVAVYIARVTAVNGGGASIDLSTTAKSGTAPTTGATGRSCTTGGAWKGPNGTDKFPFNFITSAQTNTAGYPPRVNLKNGTDYTTSTSSITHTLNGPVQFEGYTTNEGDGGRAVIANVTTTAAYSILSVSGTNINVHNLIFDGTVFTSGNTVGVSVTGAECLFCKCVFREFQAGGLNLGAVNTFAVECEAYACNKGNNTNSYGFGASGSGTFIRCIAHDNTGSNTAGFYHTSTALFISCIADTNGGKGFRVTAAGQCVMLNCDAYNNASDGLNMESSSLTLCMLENCNFVKNTGWGVNSSGSATLRNGHIQNCAFGAGTQANGSGNIFTGANGLNVSGTVTYASDVTPWVDPANGDFRINLAAAKGTGRGAFLQTASSYAGTVSYPDIGAAQHLDSGGGLLINPGMSGGMR